MGFLEIGQPIVWEALTAEVKLRVKRDGLLQLAHIWSLNVGRMDGDLYWGDEQEFSMIHLDSERREATLVAEAPAVLRALHAKEKDGAWDRSLACCKQLFLEKPRRSFLRSAEWHPEFGNHMIEATPSPPYPLSVEGVLEIEESMMSRRLKLQSVLNELYGPRVFVASMAAFPFLGVTTLLPDGRKTASFIWNPHETHDLTLFLENSVGIPQCLPNPHPRFPTLVRNVNTRRGTKVSSLVRAFSDAYTLEDPSSPLRKATGSTLAGSPPTGSPPTGSPPTGPAEAESALATSSPWSSFEGVAAWTDDRRTKALDDFKSRQEISDLSGQSSLPVRGYIYQDSFAYGMSQCCMQATFGTPDLTSARNLYDQMVVLAPLFLTLSACTPALSGVVSDLDTRWRVLEQTCDCRTDAELSELAQSRYGCAPLFIGDNEVLARDEAYYNDDLMPYDAQAMQLLSEVSTMDPRVRRHFATLWTRDPLVVFEDRIEMDNTTHAEHFENIQSTNWNTVRFKPPPPSADGCTLPKIGWRVELRTPESQLSDFENAALVGIASLLALAMVRKGAPEANDADDWSFYVPISQVRENMTTAHQRNACTEATFWWSTGARSSRRLTLRTIFLHPEVGLLPRLDKFVSAEWRQQRCSSEAVEQYRIYANFIRMRVLGRAPTNAAVLRRLIMTHEDYANDSIVTPSINYELCRASVLAGFNIAQDSASPSVCHPADHILHQVPRRSRPASIHVCKKSPVIQQLGALFGVTDQLPDRLQLAQPLQLSDHDTDADTATDPTSPIPQSC